MALKITTTVRNNMLEAIRTAGGAGGNLLIYAGTQPTDANTAISTQVLLVTLPMATAFAAAASAGVLTLTTPTTTAVTGAGTQTATFFRMLNAASSATLFDGTVGTSGADLNFSTVSFSNGANISITAPFTITAGNP